MYFGISHLFDETLSRGVFFNFFRQAVTILHERNATCIQGCKLRKTQIPHMQVHTMQPSSPLYHSITEVGELPVPQRRPSSRPTTHLISKFPPPEESKVFHTSLITQLEGREGGGRRMREEARGETPCRARPQPHFPMLVSDHQSHQGTAYREGERKSDISSHSGWEIHREKDRNESEEMSKTRNLTTLTSPLCNLGTA